MTLLRRILATIFLFLSVYRTSAENRFTQLLSKRYFIDKSLMLLHLLDENATNNFFLTYPRRFGKTVNFAMIEKFAKIQVDHIGMPIPYNATDSYNIFKRLKIANHRKLFPMHMTRYPVLSLNLHRMGKLSHGETLKSLNCELSEAVDNILWVKFLRRFYNFHKELFPTAERDMKYMSKLHRKKLKRLEMENSLFILSRILYHYFDKTKVIILIDDYDHAALNSFSSHSANLTLAYDVINMMIARALVQGPKYIRNIIIAGVTSLPFAHNQILPGFIIHPTFLDDQIYTPYYGLTRAELFDLFDKYECQQDERQLVRKYYKAYTTTQGTLIYNTYSIVRYFINRKDDQPKPYPLASYWKQTEIQDNTLPLLRYREFRHKIKDFLDKRSLKHTINGYYTKTALTQLQTLKSNDYKIFGTHHLDMFLELYFEMGYLNHGNEPDTYVIPNLEVRQILKTQMRSYQQWKLSKTLMPSFVTATDDEMWADQNPQQEDDPEESE